MAADHTELRATIHLTGILAVDVVVALKVFDLTGKLCPELRRIKKRNRSSTTLAGQSRFFHVSSTVFPSGVRAPRPVTTTLFNSI
jgi:hypothetical protein